MSLANQPPAAVVSKADGLDFDPSLREPGAGELRHFKKSRDLLNQCLTASIQNLFKDLTGLHLHVLWHEPFDVHKSGPALKFCPAVRNRSHEGGTPSTCHACLGENLRLTAPLIADKPQFIGVCGLTTFRVGIQTGDVRSPLTLALQAPIKSGKGVRRPGVSAAAFARAVAMLQLFQHDLEMTVRASVAETALERLQRRMPALAKETELRRHLRRRSRAQVTLVREATGSHAQHVVQAMVTHVHEHFHKPMSLREVALAMGMNASYLSSLFSRHLGVTFHDYLVEIRMAKARALLASPGRRICEVAIAVGYSSPDQFRHVFKSHSGVAPSAWR